MNALRTLAKSVNWDNMDVLQKKTRKDRTFLKLLIFICRKSLQQKKIKLFTSYNKRCIKLRSYKST